MKNTYTAKVRSSGAVYGTSVLDTTRSYPRTMRDAFGSDAALYTPPRFWTPVRVALCAVYAAALITFFVVL